MDYFIKLINFNSWIFVVDKYINMVLLSRIPKVIVLKITAGFF